MAGKKITVQDVAQEAGVSPATVSMVLRDTKGVSFSDETRRRVQSAAERLGYRRPQAESPFDRPTVAVFMPMVTSGYYTFITQAIAQQADLAGYDTIVMETHRNSERELRLMHSLKRIGVAGVIYTLRPLNLQLAEELARTIPTVVIRSSKIDSPLDTVITDAVRAGKLVAEHVLELGHRNVAFVNIDRTWQGYAGTDLLKGARSVFEQYPDATLKVVARPGPDTLQPGSFIQSRWLGAEMTEECLSDKSLTAFICANDYTAYGTMDALARHGLRIPEDYTVCSGDDLFSSSVSGVSLTSVDRHPVETGNNCFELLLQRIESMRSGRKMPARVTHVELLSTLIVRGSSGPARKT